MPLIKSGSRANISVGNAAYIAGFFDGEGCVNFSKTRTSWFIRVLIVNTNRDVLEYIRGIFGGDIGPMARHAGWRKAWQLRLSWTAAIDFLEMIEPYVRIKADQVHLAFCWDHFRRGSGKLSKAESECDADINAYLRECLTFLNKRGIHDLENPIERELKAGAAHATH